MRGLLASRPFIHISRIGERERYRRRLIHLQPNGFPRDFTFIPNFFSDKEQHVLLTAALQRLDAAESTKYRRRRKLEMARLEGASTSVQGLFLPDEFYCFEEGHYDGVIQRYREMHVTSWPCDDTALGPLLERLRSLYPTPATQTHILHLASDGEILPHIDNVEASGSWILGVSLGNTRAMRLEHREDSSDSYELLLPSGSVYTQRDSTRYEYKHSILQAGRLGGVDYGNGQRLSIVVRDHVNHTQL